MSSGGNLIIKTIIVIINHRIYMITDSGIGIREEILNKIFNPFFTTKEMGSGLGLAISKRIMDRS